MKDDSAYSELCYRWAAAFGIEDELREKCNKAHRGIQKILDEIGLPLEKYIIADIFDVFYDGDDFSVDYLSLGYFPFNDVGDVVTLSDLVKVDNDYKLIQSYVEENYGSDWWGFLQVIW